MEIMTLQGAAKYLNMNAEVLRRQAQKGMIPGRKMNSGKRSPWRFIREELDNFISGVDVKAEAEPESLSVLEKLIKDFRSADTEEKEVMYLTRIGRLADNRAVPFLCEVLMNSENSSNQVFWSIRALVAILGKSAGKYLHSFMEHEDDWIRTEVTIFFALENGDKRAIELLEEYFLKTKSFIVLQVLLQVKTQKYLPELKQLFASDIAHNRLLALRSLKDISFPEEEQELARLIFDQDVHVQAEALNLAIKRKYRSLIPELQKIISGSYGENIKQKAAGALAELYSD